MADQLQSSPSPKTNWDDLERTLDGRSALRTSRFRRSPMLLRRGLALAAMVLMTVGIGWIGYRISAPHHKHNRVFGHYLAQFQNNPEQAQSMLIAQYKGRPLEAGEAIGKVGYRPATADGLPRGYSVDSTFVMEMPCCTCVQTLCKRDDGSILVVFEHDDEQPNWFRGLPGIIANCGGKQCQLVEMDSQLAASWRRGKRNLTIVGARDVAEIDKMVAWLEGTRPS